MASSLRTSTHPAPPPQQQQRPSSSSIHADLFRFGEVGGTTSSLEASSFPSLNRAAAEGATPRTAPTSFLGSHNFTLNPNASSVLGMFETTCQLPPSTQQQVHLNPQPQQQPQQQQPLWRNAASSFPHAAFTAATGNAGFVGDGSSAFTFGAADPARVSAASSATNRRTPTTVLLPATVFPASILHVSKNGTTNDSANHTYTNVNTGSTGGGGNTGHGPSSGALPLPATTSPLSSNTLPCHSHVTTRDSVTSPGNGKAAKPNVPASSMGLTSSPAPPLPSQRDIQTHQAPFSVDGMVGSVSPALPTTHTSSRPTDEPIDKTKGSTTAHPAMRASGAPTLPSPLSPADFIFSPIQPGTLAGGALYTGGGSHLLASPGTPLAGGVTAMSVGVAPPASSWGDLSMGVLGTATPSPRPAMSAALHHGSGGGGGGGGVTAVGSDGTSSSSVIFYTTAATSPAAAQAHAHAQAASRASVSGATTPPVAGMKSGPTPAAPGVDWPTKPHQQQRTTHVMTLPAPQSTSTGERVAGKEGSGSSDLRRSNSNSNSSDSRPPHHQAAPTGGLQTFPATRLTLQDATSAASEHASVGSPTLDDGTDKVSSGSATGRSASGSNGYRLAAAAVTTPTSVPSSANLIFLPIDVSAVGKITPPLRHATTSPWPAPATTMAFMPSDGGDREHNSGTATTTPTSRGGSVENSPLMEGTGATVHLATPPTRPTAFPAQAVAPTSAAAAAAATVWALQHNTSSASQSLSSQQRLMQTPTPPLMLGSVHGTPNQSQTLLPRAVGPTQTRVPCTYIAPGVAVECSICLQTTEDKADPAIEDEHERALQLLLVQQQQRAGADGARDAHTATTPPLSPEGEPSSISSQHSSAVNRGVKSGSPMVRLSSCGHCFHINCLQRWLLQDDSCPMCRRAVSGALRGRAAATAPAHAEASSIGGTTPPFAAPGTNHGSVTEEPAFFLPNSASLAEAASSDAPSTWM